MHSRGPCCNLGAHLYTYTVTHSIPGSLLLQALSDNATGGQQIYDKLQGELEERDLSLSFGNSDGRRNLYKFLIGLAIIDYCNREFGGPNDRALSRDLSISRDQAFRFRRFVSSSTAFTQIGEGLYRGMGYDIRIGASGILLLTRLEGNLKDGVQFTFEEDGDEATLRAEFQGGRVLSIDQLLDKFGVDRSVWRPTLPKLNKWEMGYVDGDRNPNHYELFQVTISLERIMPLKRKFPTIRSIEIDPKPFDLSPRAEGRPYKRAVIIPDPQIGFKRNLRSGKLEPLHDRAAMDVALQIAYACEADIAIVAGDWLDLAAWSLKFQRSPEFAQTTNPALAEGAWWLKQFARVAGDRRFIPGNHEKRLEDMVISHLEEAYDLSAMGEMDGVPLLSIENLLGLGKMGWTCHSQYPHGEVWLNDQVRVSHGDTVRGGSGQTAQAVLNKSVHTEVFGHIHRLELFSRTLHHRGVARQISAFSPGCLCRTDAAVPSATARKNWQLGLGIIDYDPNGHHHGITPIPIQDGVALWNGNVFRANNREEAISEDTGWDLICPPSLYSAPYAQ